MFMLVPEQKGITVRLRRIFATTLTQRLYHRLILYCFTNFKSRFKLVSVKTTDCILFCETIVTMVRI